MSDYKIGLFTKQHAKSNFDCGEHSLNDFLKRHASQSAKKGFGITYVATSMDSNGVIGYLTLAANSISFQDMPEDLRRGLPMAYPIPTILLARLAVHNDYQGKGLGGHLLMRAGEIAVFKAEEIGIHAFVLDALNQRAKNFYLRYGFLELLDNPKHLYLPIKSVKEWFAK